MSLGRPLYRRRFDRDWVVEELCWINLRFDLLESWQVNSPVDILGRIAIHPSIRIVDIHAPVRRRHISSRIRHPLVKKLKSKFWICAPKYSVVELNEIQFISMRIRCESRIGFRDGRTFSSMYVNLEPPDPRYVPCRPIPIVNKVACRCPVQSL